MSDSHELPAVEALLTERDAILGWLARLEQRGSSAPQEVRERVRRDYQGRLDGLTEQLRDHAETVASRLRTDQAEHDGLMAEARAAREELAEVELRHEVGEYDADRFERERERHVSTLDALEQSLAVVGERIARLEGVHGLVTAPAVLPGAQDSGAEEPAPEPEQAGAATDLPDAPEVIELDVASAVEEAVADPELREAEMPRDDAPSIIELAPTDEEDADDLLAIFNAGPEAPDTEPPPDSESRDSVEREPTVLPPGGGPLSFTPRGEGPGGGPARPAVPPSAPPLGMAGADQSPRFVRPGKRGGAELAEAPSVRSPEPVRVIPDPEPVLPEVPVDAINEPVPRTLRCSECGAMNRPLEWYCEKCGAELTAV